MDSISYLAIAVCLLVAGIHGRALDDLDNSLQGGGGGGGGGNTAQPSHDWVKITEAPTPKIVQPLGTTVELECEVTGSPMPIVHWVRGNSPQNSIRGFETNLIVESSPSALVKVRSRLIIDRVMPADRSFTCVGRAGGKTAHATTTVIGTPGGKPHNLTELLAFDGPRTPRILLYYSAIFELMGNSVLLPCNVAGRPYPDIYWLDQDEEVISAGGGTNDGRLRVLPTGELLITELRWADMGLYTCIARNPAGKDSISTFVYPVLNEE